VVQHRILLGQLDRSMKRENAHENAETNPLGPRAEGRE
jgi:hypothetical protein